MTPRDTDTKTALLDAFADALARVGYPGISMSEVAAVAGIKKPSLYHHFPGGKETLYAEVAARYTDDLGTRIAQGLASGTTFSERLTALAEVSASHTPAAISFEQRVYDALDHVADEIRTEVNTAYGEKILNPVIAFFADAVEMGEVQGDASFLAMSFLDLTRGTSDVGSAVRLFLDGARARR
ncbi:TetR/AcrR family transcriptional regulator [Mumia quercus]|uniref:TetR/AcrR family transcriptional regulator n=1 Tax=Mumia quercus TaxID=2976125 RepID=UPI0021CE5BE7|nr:TetR/AcrR family transcriptional regulator [Mumia quercus]